MGGTPGGGAAAGGVGGFGKSGIFAEPGIGGATPTIVPLSRLGGGPAGRGGIAGAGGAAGGGADPGEGTPGIPPGGWFAMSIVPLNLGAAAPFKLKLHFTHVCAVASLLVPQFGQNTARSIQVEITLAQASFRGKVGLDGCARSALASATHFQAFLCKRRLEALTRRDDLRAFQRPRAEARRNPHPLSDEDGCVHPFAPPVPGAEGLRRRRGHALRLAQARSRRLTSRAS